MNNETDLSPTCWAFWHDASTIAEKDGYTLYERHGWLCECDTENGVEPGDEDSLIVNRSSYSAKVITQFYFDEEVVKP